MNPASQPNPYDRRYRLLLETGQSGPDAALAVVEAYLDGKPTHRGRLRLGRSERDRDFWASAAVRALAPADWQRDGPALALVRYFGQARVAAPEILARLDPATIVRAVRHSGLVGRPDSPRRQDLAGLAAGSPTIAELCRVLAIFDQAWAERRAGVARWTQALAGLSPPELLIYASLYAFEHLVPGVADPDAAARRRHWLDFCKALDPILTTALAAAPPASLRPDEQALAAAIGCHLTPFLFPAPDGPAPRHDLREAFARLVAAQVELDAFVAQSADAFSYDDGVRFVRHGERLELEVLDDTQRAARQDENERLGRLHAYWFRRALAAAGEAAPDPAAIRARQATLRLTEVYGVADELIADGGARAPLYLILLALGRMSESLRREVLARFARHHQATGHWQPALALTVLGDGRRGLPLIWSERAATIDRIAAWTACDPAQAAAIVDFWSSDWTATAERLRRGGKGVQPDLFERPLLRLGDLFVELPWVLGLQDGSAAAINNLRRLGARRTAADAETRRIEAGLGREFERRGFRVLHGWQPPRDDGSDAGEVDLLCVADGVVLVLELKSTYLRQSLGDAWLHAATTLRRAGLQLQRKVAAVRQALAGRASRRQLLGTTGDAGDAALPCVLGWIVDTSIECDHQRFGGFLKVSLEEVLIALRDERDGLAGASRPLPSTLYPQGFGAGRLVQVIENAEVWRDDFPGTAEAAGGPPRPELWS